MNHEIFTLSNVDKGCEILFGVGSFLVVSLFASMNVKLILLYVYVNLIHIKASALFNQRRSPMITKRFWGPNASIGNC